MGTLDQEEVRAARLRVGGALAVFGAVLVAVVVGLVWAGSQSTPGAGDTAPSGTSAAQAPAAGTSAGTSAGTAAGPVDEFPPAGGWDLAAAAGIAAAPMPQFPDAASLPQAMASTQLPGIDVPSAARANPAGVGEGFPATPEGALGQLAALEVAELADMNPQTFTEAYTSVSLPGAPAPLTTPLGAQLARIVRQATAGSGTPITSRWQLAGAQIKGVADGGRTVVACVAGQLQAVQERSAEVGTGDCQVLRWTVGPAGGDWRIAPVPAPSPAPITWPGSAAFTRAGFHPTTGGPQ